MKQYNDVKQADFCPDRIAHMKRLIETSSSIAVLGLPRIGISLFLKHLATQPFANFMYLDAFEFPNQSSIELFRTLLKKLGGENSLDSEKELLIQCKKKLEVLAKQKKKVVICLAGFDQLKKYFTKEFFDHLRSLQRVNPNKIVFVFGICKRIETLVSEQIMDSDLRLLSNRFYLKPYSEKDLRYLLSLYNSKEVTGEEQLKKAIELSGGHFQTLQLLLRSERIHDPLADPFIKLCLSEIYEHLTYRQKISLQKVAFDKNYNNKDDYLLNIGIVKKVNDKYKLFSPLFAEFVKTKATFKLPVKEGKLFKLLKSNLGRVVSKDEIFDAIWKDDLEHASDWALDSLIYRLRKHPAFLSKGFIIENHKKMGYTLLRN